MKKYISLAENAAENLRQMILFGDTYKPGDQLPNEAKLSEMLNVSRTSVREAVKILIAENILEIHRGVGTFVKNNIGSSSNKFDMFYMNNKKQDLKDSLQLRFIIEPAMIRSCIENATVEELNKIYEMEEKCRTAACSDNGFNSGAFSEYDLEFHKALAKATHNQVFEQLTPLLHQSISIIRKSAKDADITQALMDNAVINHKLIVECIKKKDYEGAKIYSETHVYNTCRLMEIGK